MTDVQGDSLERVHEIARTSYSVINKYFHANGFVVVKHVVATPSAKDLWRTEVNALTNLGVHVRSTRTISRKAMLTIQPHVATMISSHEPSLSITLRYETGRSLNNFVDRDLVSIVPLQSCDQIFLQMAGALSFIHDRRMIHDDVKPENIMWSPDDYRAVLVDFGAALFDSEYTESGTPPYAAPEYLARIKTCESDIWACGITLAFVFGYFPLPSGDWLLPNALLPDTKDRKDMDEWLSFIGFITKDVIDRDEPLLGQMLKLCPDTRVTSKELVKKLSERMLSLLE